MIELRKDLPRLPERMTALPVDARGFPVPWFVEWVNGEPKFQIANSRKWLLAVKGKRCWLCGKSMGAFKAFVIGPMCGVNRVSSEPPSHRDCAEFAVTACPFLTRPTAKRSDRGLDGIETKRPGGMMIERNPGVTLLWITKSYRVFQTGTGPLIEIGDPIECHFYREGREALRAEIDASVSTGLPLLEDMARKQGGAAVIALSRQLQTFHQLLQCVR